MFSKDLACISSFVRVPYIAAAYSIAEGTIDSMPVPLAADGITSNYGGDMPMSTKTYYTLTVCADCGVQSKS